MNLLWPEPDEAATLRSRGLSLETLTWGDPEQADLTLLCLHGYLDCAAVFAPLAAELRSQAGRRRLDVALVAMTFAGHAGSETADSYGWFGHTVDVLTFLDRHRSAARGAVGVLGHSFGAVQMLEALNIDAHGVDLAVNLDAVSGPFALGGERLGEALAAAATSDVRALPEYDSPEELVRRRRTFNPRLSEETLRRLVPRLAVAGPGGWRWRVDPALVGWIRPWDLDALQPADPLELTRRLPIEVLTITGDAQDEPRIRGRHPGAAAINAVPNLRHVGISSAGHYVHLEATDVVATAIVDHALAADRRESA